APTLTVTACERLTQLARLIRKADQHSYEKRPRNDEHGRGLERLGGRRTLGLGEQRDLSQKRARTDREVLAVVRRRPLESAGLDHETALSLVAAGEQHLPPTDVGVRRSARPEWQTRDAPRGP